jgi:hypothetical protein
MQLHPAVAFASAIVGASVLGAIGAFLALPAAAIIQAVLSTYLDRYKVVESNLTSDQPPPPDPKPQQPKALARVVQRIRNRGPAGEASPSPAE